MTTKVTVETHDWPVEITVMDLRVDDEPLVSKETVDPHGRRDVYLHSGRSVSFVELAKPE